MSRVRRIDKAVLELNEPLDSQDQELLISDFIRRNDDSLAMYTKVLGALILFEIPLLVWIIRAIDPYPRTALKIITITLSCVLTLINLSYDIGKMADQINQQVQNVTRAAIVKRLVSFGSINVINALLLLKLATVIERSWISLYYFVPLGNLITMNLLYYWHEQMKGNVKELNGLKYDYKSV